MTLVTVLITFFVLLLAGVVIFIIVQSYKTYITVTREDCLGVLDPVVWKTTLQIVHELQERGQGELLIWEVHNLLDELHQDGLVERESRPPRRPEVRSGKNELWYRLKYTTSVSDVPIEPESLVV